MRRTARRPGSVIRSSATPERFKRSFIAAGMLLFPADNPGRPDWISGQGRTGRPALLAPTNDSTIHGSSGAPLAKGAPSTGFGKVAGGTGRSVRTPFRKSNKGAWRGPARVGPDGDGSGTSDAVRLAVAASFCAAGVALCSAGITGSLSVSPCGAVGWNSRGTGHRPVCAFGA